jgi:hypothetical protein
LPKLKIDIIELMGWCDNVLIWKYDNLKMGECEDLGIGGCDALSVVEVWRL